MFRGDTQLHSSFLGMPPKKFTVELNARSVVKMPYF